MTPCDTERAFDIADSVEKGLAREVATDFVVPLKRSSRLWRFQVVRSEDKLHYRLLCDRGTFLMYAKVALEAYKVEFFLYNPDEKEEPLLYDPTRPAFTMSFNQEHTEWRLVQERCERCGLFPKRLSCFCLGKQQVALIRHVQKPLFKGVCNSMEVLIPGLPDGGRVIWCPLLGRGDLAAPSDASCQVQRLHSKQPTWNDEVDSLVLDFKGRQVLSSSKNFQMATSRKPEQVVCQCCKIAPSTFALDFCHPLNIIQAFGACVSTLFWT